MRLLAVRFHSAKCILSYCLNCASLIFIRIERIFQQSALHRLAMVNGPLFPKEIERGREAMKTCE